MSVEPRGPIGKTKDFPDKECFVCGAKFNRREGQTASNFHKRKTCSDRCHNVLNKFRKLDAHREIQKKLERLVHLEKLVKHHGLK